MGNFEFLVNSVIWYVINPVVIV